MRREIGNEGRERREEGRGGACPTNKKIIPAPLSQSFFELTVG